MTFTMHTECNYDDGSTWYAAYVNDDKSKGIGLYVSDGEAITDDFDSWNLDNDLIAMEIDPESDEGELLKNNWIDYCLEYDMEE